MFTSFNVWIFISFASVSYSEKAPVLRIVGGEDVSIEDFPYQVSITHMQQFICGGSIINERFVLTAAHCTAKDPVPSRYIVRAGSDYTFKDGTLHEVTEIILHETFQSKNNNIRNDICLLKIQPYFIFDSEHQSIPLNEIRDVIPAGIMTTVSGFGKTSEDSQSTRKLMAVNIPIIDWNYCHDYYTKKNMLLTPDFICAGVEKNDKNSCQGDSGGPLVINRTLIGIVSWGVGCTKPGYPGAYTNIAYFVDWIKEKIVKNSNNEITEMSHEKNSHQNKILISHLHKQLPQPNLYRVWNKISHQMYRPHLVNNWNTFLRHYPCLSVHFPHWLNNVF